MKLFKGRRVVLGNGQVSPASIIVDAGKIIEVILGEIEASTGEYSEFIAYLPPTMKLFKGRRVIHGNGQLSPASIIVDAGKIIDVILGEIETSTKTYSEVVDAGDLVLMAGVVDSHVHLNEPGRTEWEGFWTATRAAAAGGITTVIDMPLNSIPSTTTVEAFRTKINEAWGQCFVNVGFWGGVVPGNKDELRPMVDAGICGFKCFMIHSGVDEFGFVGEDDIRAALEELRGTDRVLMFHAEVETNDVAKSGTDPCLYDTFLKSRPDSMEVQAIETICRLCREYNVRCHVVHLSSADAIEVIKRAKEDGAPLSVETTHHYLTLDAESVPKGATQYKCCPPIRSKDNQERLWRALKAGDIDMVVSDHSPCTADLKLMDAGDFLEAWGGIASLQFGLSLFWTHAQKLDLTLADVARLLCEKTAALCSMGNRKGAIKVGYDADFVIWDPDSSFKVEPSIIQHKNKITPYTGETLRGVVHRTIVAGETVFENGVIIDSPTGHLVFPEQA